MTTSLLLNGIDKVKNFVQIANRYPFLIDLRSDRYVVDGKSIMGVFSLELSKPVVLGLPDDDESVNDFLKDIQELIVED